MHEPTEKAYKEIVRSLQEINDLSSVDAILEKVLREARVLTKADAGTIFLVEKENLRFSYVQNDTLFAGDKVNPEVYSNYTVPIDMKSIVGYSATTGETVNITDAYALPDTAPFGFNKDFDIKNSYRTQSILAIPLKSYQQKIVGVLQLINAKDPTGAVVSFSTEQRELLPVFTINATIAIERGVMTRELVLRMMKMAELRDPSETGAHVLRVGAYAAEIYHQWALNAGVDWKERRRNKDLIRIAAMLHDVGKVGISDLILKKPARLTDEEFLTMKWHTALGAGLFSNATSELDALSRDIALNHHEKWDGSGYPGDVDIVNMDDMTMGKGKKGEEIPLAARIVALADVFDALVSRRSYKEPMSYEQALGIIQDEAGSHFDPDVVIAFDEVFFVCKAIHSRYTAETQLNEIPIE
ncbi:MAG: HD domain-containing protein [Nitrospinota bacterium]|nr:HD domain-containing protein [Nitrospinota bacterium]MDH5677679.1 HD domain-containing protein [Nitrospinota bacterium]